MALPVLYQPYANFFRFLNHYQDKISIYLHNLCLEVFQKEPEDLKTNYTFWIVLTAAVMFHVIPLAVVVCYYCMPDC